MDSTIEGVIVQIRDQLIEKIIKPLLIANFGERKNFGSFSYQQSADPAVANARVSTIISAIASQILPNNDPDVINKLREDLSLPPLSRQEVDNMRNQKQLNEQLGLLQQQLQLQQTMMQQEQGPTTEIS